MDEETCMQIWCCWFWECFLCHSGISFWCFVLASRAVCTMSLIASQWWSTCRSWQEDSLTMTSLKWSCRSMAGKVINGHCLQRIARSTRDSCGMMMVMSCCLSSIATSVYSECIDCCVIHVTAHLSVYFPLGAARLFENMKVVERLKCYA